MNGSPTHVRAPYRGEGPGNRSGSGTDALFNILRRRDIELDKSIEPLVGQPGRQRTPDAGNASWTGAQMYHLFADPQWLIAHAACEGVAQVSQIATTEASEPRGLARLFRRRPR